MRRTVRWKVVPLIGLLLTLVLGAVPATAAPPSFAEPAFQQVWERFDKPVDELVAARSWTWGPNTYF